MAYHYQFLPTQINFFTTNNLDLTEYEDESWHSLELDFSNATFITPYGLVFIYSLVRHLREKYRGRPVHLILPRSKDVLTYISRMNLIILLNKIDGVTTFPREYTINIHENLRLHELSIRGIPSDDAADSEAGKLFELIQEHCNYGPLTSDIINMALSELLSNVHCHSARESAFIAAQTYREELLISVGDIGVGIPARLGTITGLTDDMELIFESLKPRVSSAGGGMGLTMIMSGLGDVKDERWAKRRLMIRSNGAWISKEGGGDEVYGRRTSYIVQGTFVNIYLKK